MAFPQVWITDEVPARALIVKGWSAIDCDCLVAYLEGSSDPLWIVESSGYVCGLNGAYAREVKTDQPAPARPVLRDNRHEWHPH